MDLRLETKTAIVTGGSRGIGKAIAKAYAEAGAKVMITSRKAEVCEAAAEEIGHGVLWRAGNVGDPESAEAVVAATIEEFGGVDVLVNNAATNPYAGPMIDVDLGRWDKTFQVNVTAPLVWTQLCWNLWMKEHGGSVINVSSVGALGTSPALGVYSTTKAALIHMTEELAAELAPQVRVNALAPGLVKTDFARALWDGGRGDEVARAYPLKRLGEVDDIAGAALYLASDMSSFMTGRTLVLDGGGLIGHRPIA
jgi:NAD(P)-dependent dehydrogenase (short-subunit alcohol dehydrogenase family)